MQELRKNMFKINYNKIRQNLKLKTTKSFLLKQIYNLKKKLQMTSFRFTKKTSQFLNTSNITYILN